MLTVKTSVAAAAFGAAILGTAGITYAITKASLQVSVECPPSVATSPSASKPALPQGTPVPLNQGKTY
jgi:hypothetical protein